MLLPDKLQLCYFAQRQRVHFNKQDSRRAWATLSNSRALSTDWDKHVLKHPYAITHMHTLEAHCHTQSNTQPEAEDLRLHSGTWSQSHLGPQILPCSSQSGLILCSTESCGAPPCLPYLPTSVLVNSSGPLLFLFHGLKGFPGRGALVHVCTASLSASEESLGMQGGWESGSPSYGSRA